MSSTTGIHGEDHSERVCLYAVRALPPGDVFAVAAQIAECADCRAELYALRPVVESFVAWPTDVVRPPVELWDRLAERVSADGGTPVLPARDRWVEPAWKDVAPGIAVKLLASDADTSRVSMLVRLEPGCEYPSHRHAGVEELHLLQGELWIDARKLRPGDYNRAEPGTIDRRVWSETGCTCVLITSPSDVLR